MKKLASGAVLEIPCDGEMERLVDRLSRDMNVNVHRLISYCLKESSLTAHKRVLTPSEDVA